MAGPVVQSGTYLLELDTGYDYLSFRLDNSDPGKGILDNTTYTLGPNANTYADITEYVTTIAYNRGRQKTDYQFGAGTMSFIMRDLTGILGPYDTTSPYYDPGNNEPGLAPMRKVRLSRGGEYLFTGVVTSYYYQFEYAGPNYVNVQCADEFYKLAQTNISTRSVTAETSGQRITTVLAYPEVNYTGTTSIATGTVNLGHSSAYNIPESTNTLSYLQQINDAEQGRLFVSRTGTITFQKRIGSTLTPSLISFKDDGTGAKYTDVQIEFDADNVVNRAYVQGLNGTNATQSDSTSIAKYFTQNWAITDSLLHDSGEIGNLATYLLEPDPTPRYTSVTTWYGTLTNAQRNTVTTIDVGDTISIHKSIPGLGSTVAETLSVEGIRGVIDVNRGHTITYYTSPTVILYELILDDTIYGKLDFNVLG